MKVLITGGAGFIGSHIADAYLAAGWDVLVADNLGSGKIENLDPAAQFTKIDICSPEFAEYIEDRRPDVVVHAAAQISVSFSVREPAFDARQNIIGPLDMCMACVRAGVKKIIFSSSGGTIYGEIPGEPATEDHPYSPLSPYGISKMAFEYYLQFFQREYGLEYTSLRYGNVFGPRQDPHGEAGVVAIFSKMILNGQTPTINGDGKFYRDYVFAADVARANFLAAEKGANRAYNIGTCKATDVNDVYKLVAEAAGVSTPPNFGPPRAGDLRRCVLGISRAAQELGWTPQVSLEQGMKQTVDFFRDHM
jgi:UDP-glucose 4-epimerase